MPPMRSKAEKVPMKTGDQVRLQSPGGGGFGSPKERPIEAVQADLNAGLISVETAKREYGVKAKRVLDDSNNSDDQFLRFTAAR